LEEGALEVATELMAREILGNGDLSVTQESQMVS
jgi:hypothetical protein